MNARNLKTRLAENLAAIYAEKLTKGEVYDRTLELVEFITLALLKHPDMRVPHLVHIYGLEEDVEEGLPDDSSKILSFNFASNIVQVMFEAQAKISEENEARLEAIIEECEAGNVTKIH